MTQQSKSFRDLFYGLSSDPLNDIQSLCRIRILTKCGISKGTLYNWLAGRHKVPVSAQSVIGDVMRNYYGADVQISFEIEGKEASV
jgi:hypothetical protein